MEKTAVDWLQCEIKADVTKFLDGEIDKRILLSFISIAKEKAKELFEQQITRAYSTGGYDERDNPTREAHEYYSETFKSE